MLNRQQVHTIAVGDTRTPLGVTLMQGGEPVDLTGYTVKFRMVDSSGADVVTETDTGVTVTDAVAGQAQYGFAADDVGTAGTYYGFFTVYNGSAKRDTFPPDGRKLRIDII